MFGYEGEGFDRSADDFSPRADRGWNIGGSYRGRGPKNYRRSDDAIRDDVCERLTMDHDVDATDVEVNVHEAVVTLTGTVTDRQTKRLAEDIADSVRGVKDVNNELRVARAEQQR